MDPSPTRRDGDVRVLQDAAATVRSLKKDADAQWVTGLRPEDELLELQRIASRRREEQRRGEEASDIRAKAVSASSPNWLRWPLIIGTVWVIALWLRVADYFPVGSQGRTVVQQGEFPPYEFHLWNTIRTTMEPHGVMSVLIDLVLPSVGITTVASLFALFTTFRFGAATQNFLCFVGFGVSTLGLFSGLSTGAIFLAGCKSSATQDECFTPMVSAWVASIMRWVFPWVALWPIATLWDDLRSRRLLARGGRGGVIPVWRTLCTLPIVGYALLIASARWACFRTDTTMCGEPIPVAFSSLVQSLVTMHLGPHRHYGALQLGLDGIEFISACVATALVVRLAMQKPLGLVPREAAEEGREYAALPPPPLGASTTSRKEKNE
jgi:hypothetical protein